MATPTPVPVVPIIPVISVTPVPTPPPYIPVVNPPAHCAICKQELGHGGYKGAVCPICRCKETAAILPEGWLCANCGRVNEHSVMTGGYIKGALFCVCSIQRRREAIGSQNEAAQAESFGVRWAAIPGWFVQADAQIYRKWAEESPPDATIVEVGTYLGRSAVALMEALDALGKDGVTVYTVDNFKCSRPAHAAWYLEPWALRTRLVQDDGVGYAKRFEDKSLWGVYIDTWHRRTDIQPQVEAWLPKVKSGGRIGGHDYGQEWAETTEYVDEVFPAHNLYGASWEALIP